MRVLSPRNSAISERLFTHSDCAVPQITISNGPIEAGAVPLVLSQGRMLETGRGGTFDATGLLRVTLLILGGAFASPADV